MKNGIAHAIEKAGGQSKLAAELGLPRQQVNAWALGRERVPLKHLTKIEKLTGISRELLRPDVFQAQC